MHRENLDAVWATIFMILALGFAGCAPETDSLASVEAYAVYAEEKNPAE